MGKSPGTRQSKTYNLKFGQCTWRRVKVGDGVEVAQGLGVWGGSSHSKCALWAITRIGDIFPEQWETMVGQ